MTPSLIKVRNFHLAPQLQSQQCSQRLVHRERTFYALHICHLMLSVFPEFVTYIILQKAPVLCTCQFHKNRRLAHRYYIFITYYTLHINYLLCKCVTDTWQSEVLHRLKTGGLTPSSSASDQVLQIITETWGFTDAMLKSCIFFHVRMVLLITRPSVHLSWRTSKLLQNLKKYDAIAKN